MQTVYLRTGEKQEQYGIFRRGSTEFGQPRKEVSGLNQTTVGQGFSPILRELEAYYI